MAFSSTAAAAARRSAGCAGSRLVRSRSNRSGSTLVSRPARAASASRRTSVRPRLSRATRSKRRLQLGELRLSAPAPRARPRPPAASRRRSPPASARDERRDPGCRQLLQPCAAGIDGETQPPSPKRGQPRSIDRALATVSASSSWIAGVLGELARASAADRRARRRVRFGAARRSWKNPASALPHSGWRAAIHQAVSFSTGSGESSSGMSRLGLQAAAVHLIERDERGALRARGAAACSPARGRRRIADFDQRVGQRVLEHAVDAATPAAASRAGDGPASPMRPSASAAARCTAGRPDFSASTSCGSAAVVAPETRRSEAPPDARSRRDRPARVGPPRAPARSRCASAPRRRCAAPPRSATVSARPRAPDTAAAPACPNCVQRPALHGRPRIVEQLRQLGRRHRVPRELRPRGSSSSRRALSGGRGRSRRAPPAWRAATSGNRACTRGRCRSRAGCRRHPRARRSG